MRKVSGGLGAVLVEDGVEVLVVVWLGCCVVVQGFNEGSGVVKFGDCR